VTERPVAMISGTVQDLPEHRRAAVEACLRQDFFPRLMENLPPSADDAVTLSLQMVDEADVYVLVLGVRYGEIPDGYDKSFTHLELDRALQQDMPVLAMLMDLDRHPIRPVDMELGAGADRLRKLREELRQRQHVSFFDSPESLRALLIDGLSALRSRFGERTRSLHYVRQLPRPPEPYIAHPYTLLHTRDLVGRQRDLNGLTDWVIDASRCRDPVLAVTAIGGMGKSALTWTWFHEIAPLEMRRMAGRVWWSFYESDARFENFVTRTLSYVTGRPVEELTRLPLAEREEELLAALDTKPYLVVLDGLERLLIAYARPDAAHLADDDLDARTANVVADRMALPASASSSFTGQSRLRLTADPRVGMFLKRLTTLRASRVLISTRLFPADLQTVTGEPVPGAAAYFLSGLIDEDAVTLWRAFGVSGGRDELVTLFRSFENYPLLIRALAGEVTRFRGGPRDFDAWRAAHPGFNPFALELKQRNSHVLEHALRGVTTEQLRTLHLIAAFRMPATYQALTALLIGPDKPFGSETELDRALEELEDRGLLGWDKVANRYDLHPIVRGVAWAGLDPNSQHGIYTDLAGHFGSLPKPDDEQVFSVDDLSGALEHCYTLIALGNAEEAHGLINYRLLDPLIDLAAFSTLTELVQALIDQPEVFAQLSSTKQAENLLTLGVCHEYAGNPSRALESYRWFEIADEDEFLLAFLPTLQSRALRWLGRLVESEQTARASLAQDDDDEFEPWGISALAGALAVRGLAAEAMEWMSDVRLVGDNNFLNDLFGCEPEHALLALQAEQLSTAVALCRGIERETAGITHGRRLLAVRGATARAAVASQLGAEDEAGQLLHEALTEARLRGLGDEEVALLIQLADWHLCRAELPQARRCLNQTETPIQHGQLRLRKADALNILSRIERSEGNVDKAAEAASDAFRAAWCDGPPFAYASALELARENLRALGAAEPDGLDTCPAVPMPPITVTPWTPEAILRGAATDDPTWTPHDITKAARAAVRWHPDCQALLMDFFDGEAGEETIAAVLAAEPSLYSAAAGHPRPAVRAVAAAGLSIEDCDQREALHRMATGDPAPAVRAAALRRFVTDSAWTFAADELSSLALSDPVPDVRLVALDVAWRHDELAEGTVRLRASEDPDPVVRSGILKMIIPLGPESAPLGRDDVAMLFDRGRDLDSQVRDAALARLVNDQNRYPDHWNARQIDDLVAAIVEHAEGSDLFGPSSELLASPVSESVLRQLSPIPAWKVLVRAAANSVTWRQRRWALDLLLWEAQEPGHEHVINEVFDLLRAETDPDVLADALEAVSEVPLTIHDFLRELIADADAMRRATAAGALRTLAVPVTGSEWRALLEDNDAEVRSLALESLIHRTDPENLRLLSRDLDGMRPLLDPAEISESWVDHVAKQTDMSVDEVKRWYEERAQIYRLRLTWQPDQAPSRGGEPG
jgi:Domain of unknown function (DUF4062)